MSDAAIFTLVFGGLFVLRIIAATIVFLLILPRGDRCPMCDAVTVRLHTRLGRRWTLQLAKRWCLTCGWEGYMRLPAETARSAPERHPAAAPTSGQPSRTP